MHQGSTAKSATFSRSSHLSRVSGYQENHKSWKNFILMATAAQTPTRMLEYLIGLKERAPRFEVIVMLKAHLHLQYSLRTLNDPS